MQALRQSGRTGAAALSLALALALAACSPTFDWRVNMAEGTGLVATFPCRPDRHSRNVGLGGETVRMEMLVCSAGDATFAVGFYDAADPRAVQNGLANLRAAMLANVQAVSPRQRPFELAGANASPAAVRVTADGRRPDGGGLRLEAAFFARDLRVFQVAVIGPPLTDDAIDPFFEGLKLPT